MQDQAPSSRLPTILPWNRLTNFKQIATFLAILALTSLLLYSWNDLTSCLRRQGFAMIIALILWHSRQEGFVKFLCKTLLVTIIFIIIQGINSKDFETTTVCKMSETQTNQLINGLYTLFFCYYISLSVILGCFMIGLAVNYWCYGGSIFILVEASRRRARSSSNQSDSIEDEDLEALEKVQYYSISTNEHNSSCSICLNEFHDQEEIIKLPVCSHYFHKDCIKTWLSTRCECPYCRSNIKLNLQFLRDQSLEETGSTVNTSQSVALELSNNLKENIRSGQEDIETVLI